MQRRLIQKCYRALRTASQTSPQLLKCLCAFTGRRFLGLFFVPIVQKVQSEPVNSIGDRFLDALSLWHQGALRPCRFLKLELVWEPRSVAWGMWHQGSAAPAVVFLAQRFSALSALAASFTRSVVPSFAASRASRQSGARL